MQAAFIAQDVLFILLYLALGARIVVQYTLYENEHERWWWFYSKPPPPISSSSARTTRRTTSTTTATSTSFFSEAPKRAQHVFFKLVI